MVNYNKPWKTIVLNEDRATDATALIQRWETFFGINVQTDLNDAVYVALFNNNTVANYAADMIVWTLDENGNVVRVSMRQNWTSVATSTARSLYASAGTIIDIYRLSNHNS